MDPRFHHALRAAATALLLGLGACGVGGALAASGGGGGGGGSSTRPPRPPEVTVAAPAADPASNYVTIPFVLRDPQVDRAEERDGGIIDPRVQVFAEYQVAGDPRWLPMTDSRIVGSDGTRTLSLGDHTFVWNTLVDLPAYTGRVRVRIRAEYELSAPFRRRFRVREIEFRVDNRLVGTIFGGDVTPTPDIDTFPVDVRADGNAIVIACAGAGIVERVDALGNTRRVVGVGVPGDTGDGGDPGVARLDNVRAVDVDPMSGLVYTNHDSRLRVTNPLLTPKQIGSGQFGGRTINGLLSGISNARSLRVHPSGAVLFIDGRARILALNPKTPAVGGLNDIMLAGTLITPGSVAQIAGDGATDADGTPAAQVALTDATSLAIGPDGEIYYGEQNIGRVRVINVRPTPLQLPEVLVGGNSVATVAGGNGLGLAGDGGSARAARLNRQDSLDCSASRQLFVCDTFNLRVRLVNLGVGDTTFAGTTVRSGEIDTIAGGGTGGIGSLARETALGAPNAVAVGVSGTIVIADQRKVILVNGTDATVTAYGKTAQGGRTREVYDASRRAGLPLVGPLAVHARSQDEVFFTDRSTVRVLNLRSSPEVFGGAVAGPGEVAEIAGGAVPGFSGDGDSARAAAFGFPAALTTDGPFKLYVADTANDVVRFINIGDPVTTPAQTAFGTSVAPGSVDRIVGGAPGPLLDDGDGLAPRQCSLSSPSGLAVFAGLLFVADTGHHRVRCVNPGPDDVSVAGVVVAAGTVRTVYGDGTAGASADGAGPWRTNAPTALAVDSRGLLYISEPGNARVRVLNTGLTAAAQAGVSLAGVDIAANAAATLVGTGVRGNFGDGGSAPDAQIDAPGALLVQSLADGTPVALYLSDTPSQVVRIVNLTVADIVAATDELGRASITVPPGGIFTIAGGPNAIGSPNPPAFSGDGDLPERMRLSSPRGVAITNFDDRPAHLIVADSENNRLRRFGAPPIVLPGN